MGLAFHPGLACSVTCKAVQYQLDFCEDLAWLMCKVRPCIGLDRVTSWLTSLMPGAGRKLLQNDDDGTDGGRKLLQNDDDGTDGGRKLLQNDDDGTDGGGQRLIRQCVDCAEYSTSCNPFVHVMSQPCTCLPFKCS